MDLSIGILENKATTFVNVNLRLALTLTSVIHAYAR